MSDIEVPKALEQPLAEAAQDEFEGSCAVPMPTALAAKCCWA